MSDKHPDRSFSTLPSFLGRLVDRAQKNKAFILTYKAAFASWLSFLGVATIVGFVVDMSSFQADTTKDDIGYIKRQLANLPQAAPHSPSSSPEATSLAPNPADDNASKQMGSSSTTPAGILAAPLQTPAGQSPDHREKLFPDVPGLPSRDGVIPEAPPSTGAEAEPPSSVPAEAFGKRDASSPVGGSLPASRASPLARREEQPPLRQQEAALSAFPPNNERPEAENAGGDQNPLFGVIYASSTRYSDMDAEIADALKNLKRMLGEQGLKIESNRDNASTIADLSLREIIRRHQIFGTYIYYDVSVRVKVDFVRLKGSEILRSFVSEGSNQGRDETHARLAATKNALQTIAEEVKLASRYSNIDRK